MISLTDNLFRADFCQPRTFANSGFRDTSNNILNIKFGW